MNNTSKFRVIASEVPTCPPECSEGGRDERSNLVWESMGQSEIVPLLDSANERDSKSGTSADDASQ